MARKSWSEKFNGSVSHEVKTAPKDFADIKAGQRMLLTSAQNIAACLEELPPGKEVDIKGLRRVLSEKAGADIACPVVTGICLRIVAEYAGEKLDTGLSPKDVPPVWRAMPAGAPIWKKVENGKKHFIRLRKGEHLAV